MQLRRWSDAAREFGEVISSGRYTLASNYVDNFTVSGENNPESVFEVQFSGELRGGGQDVAGASEGANRARFFGPPGFGFADGEARRWVYDEFLLERDANNNVDLRLNATLLHNNYLDLDPTRAKLTVTDTVTYGTGFNRLFPPGTGNNRRLFWRKYLNDRTLTGPENFDSPINFRVIRYADVLLLYAEALNELGRTAEAYPLIDQVRLRANMRTLQASGKAGLTQDQMRMQLMHERVVELAGENVRWFDLQRWNFLSTEAGTREITTDDVAPRLHDSFDTDFTNFEIGKSALLPLPQTDVDISGLQQNPRW